MTKKKKLKPIVIWETDVQCYGYTVKVRARTEGEARKKTWEKCKKIPLLKAVNKKNSYTDKDWRQ